MHIENPTQYFGGKETVCRNIAAAIRAKDPSHPIALADDPVTTIATYQMSDLSSILFSLDIMLEEAIGPCTLSKESLDTISRKVLGMTDKTRTAIQENNAHSATTDH